MQLLHCTEKIFESQKQEDSENFTVKQEIKISLGDTKIDLEKSERHIASLKYLNDRSGKPRKLFHRMPGEARPGSIAT